LKDSRAGFVPFQFAKTGVGSTTGLCQDLVAQPGLGTPIQCQAGLFNDRLVALAIEVPMNYGCQANTGPDPTTGLATTPCVDANPLPEGGWWKIRYTPSKEDTNPLTPYLRMTDATTWTVQLLGDPVHLVQSDK
jgi:hypothetical protein